MHDLNIRVNSHIGLAFAFIFSYLILIKGDCGRNAYNEDNERRVMSYNLELSYKMAILSAVTYDQSHPQDCLDQYLPSAKFQLQAVFTKKCETAIWLPPSWNMLRPQFYYNMLRCVCVCVCVCGFLLLLFVCLFVF